MRILHTSDWHIGRSFHGHSTLDALGGVLEELAGQVRDHQVDVVIVAGDIFDSSTPAAGAYTLLTNVLQAIRAAGAQIVLTSGNHDSAARLGFQAAFLGQAGVHVITQPLSVGQPVTIEDDSGPVHFYGVPYLEPALVRHLWPEAQMRTQEQAMRHAMSLIAADRQQRGGRSVAIAHCFAAGVEPTPQLEREVRQDLAQGRLDVVPLIDLAGPDYVALGHIHGRATLDERIRYCGAPLHYSFGEGHKPRGSWLVDIDASGQLDVSWLDLPVPRRLTTLRGTLQDLLDNTEYDAHTNDWVCAVLTDPTPQTEPMRKLQARFPFCATIQPDPDRTDTGPARTYRDRVRKGASDAQLAGDFLELVRAGDGAEEEERQLLAEVISEYRAGAQA
ncbi:exonuclease SbcCD subunit D [Microbacterium amylolyticum]|uniref:Nuclease SbcCD subunit D n=1 Tax=Microbacterium amylolyticum TaxID=936337 RepID=A0ABS4ZJX0_9MICO|nr:exonuclease SbcCD subunit D [Microbacterium amylolyticum]MBP2437303.1 exonuclease SbcD [Microbacterium amylolyticum]